ncbi:MAG: PAS domain-containing protein, partial [bacterium]
NPDDRAQEVTDFQRQTREGGERVLHKTRFIHKDGSEIIAFTRNYPLKIDEEIIGWVGEIFPTDENDEMISAQQTTERKLDFLVDHVAKNSAKLNTFMKALRDPVFRSDADGNTIDCNQAYLDLFQLRLDEIGTPKWITRLDPRGLEETLERIEHAFSNHESFTYDNKLRDDIVDGGKYLRFSGNPIFEGGEFAGYIGSIVEISRDEVTNLPNGVD